LRKNHENRSRNNLSCTEHGEQIQNLKLKRLYGAEFCAFGISICLDFRLPARSPAYQSLVRRVGTPAKAGVSSFEFDIFVSNWSEKDASPDIRMVLGFSTSIYRSGPSEAGR
jgi:hypothetical protein